MSDIRLPRRRFPLITAVLATASVAVAGCGSSDSSSDAVPGGGGDDTAASGLDAVYEDAPVADDAAILPDSTMAEIKERGVLRVAAALDAPLLSQQDPSNPEDVEGFDIDLAKMLAIYILGEPNIEIVPPASETREALLQNGTVDAVFNTYTITEERAEQIDFAGPYFTSGLAIATRADNEDIDSVEDLNGKDVIVGANTPAVTAVPEVAPDAEVTSFATDPQAVQALLQGRGDAYVQDYTLLLAAAANNPDIKIAVQPFTEEPYGIGLPPEDAEYKEFVNDWLEQIQEDGSWAEIWEATLGTVVEGDAPTPPEIGSVPGS
ncbi:glutamate ABC transporter substrate-binding protein [Modestobacter sp. VKM Ac-2983]|uniref:glutamate ABC transporter substrate-binding protein n=1 Tax=Modestobacter sp. VKM Ac-2983 TaxID=3004137 RepID=UPI0022ABAB20|nr:glutamate ABC transporter substrate-binding protein [Modestobacter sp. VKM Ac-2983]MCZ2804903.1 glutamate ABC transporter substrate-binding protein [Modestobacter sp. VKM Ac-2983]